MKKTIIAICALVVSLVFTGCSCSSKGVEQEQMVDMSTAQCCYVYVDQATGVNYIIYASSNRGGICPRYNADGSLYVSQKE